MARSRLELHAELEGVLTPVYYQPPENYKLVYPCILYELQRISSAHADNFPYKQNPQYQVTLIDRDPDSEFVAPLAAMRGIRFDRKFTSENLHHFVYVLTLM